MNKELFHSLCVKSFEQNGISRLATDENVDKLYELSGVFSRAIAVMNLTAIKDEELMISRHFADCLIPEFLFPEGAKVLDVGSGGGMPTLPLAIARPDLHITALDATEKKTRYISSAAEELGLSNVSTITARAEEAAHTSLRESFDCVTARAVAELRILLEWCAPYIKVGGSFIALKGLRADEELENAINAVEKLGLVLEKNESDTLIDLDGTESTRHTFVFKKVRKTPALYPRKNAQIQKNPL